MSLLPDQRITSALSPDAAGGPPPRLSVLEPGGLQRIRSQLSVAGEIPIIPADVRKRQERRILAEDPQWNLAPVEKLSDACMRVIVKNFEQRPILRGIPQKYRERVLSSISVDLPLPIAGPLIPDDESYWRRRAAARFKNPEPARHGKSWKRLFFELHMRETIESFIPRSPFACGAATRNLQRQPAQPVQSKMGADPLGIKQLEDLIGFSLSVLPTSGAWSITFPTAVATSGDGHTDAEDVARGREALARLISDLRLASPFVQALNLEQLRPSAPPEGVQVKATDPRPDHIDLLLLSAYLPHLTELSLVYGVRDCGINFDWKQFGMTLADAQSLSHTCLMACLRKLSIRMSGIDDDKCRLIAAALIENRSVSELDLSHNKIGDGGARGLAKVLATAGSRLTQLNLANNRIGPLGAKSIGFALADPNRGLNLRMNRIADTGGAELLTCLTRNVTLRTLDLSCNALNGPLIVPAFCALLRHASPALITVDMSCNRLGSSGVASGSSIGVDATSPGAVSVPIIGDANGLEGVKPQTGGDGDLEGKMIFEAITQNKYVTTLDLRVTELSQEYLIAIQATINEVSC
ncbi:hypothetical protein BJ742DRAFT_670594 [Cladochytrium replicatum]|nr:hypothetical protein BJ742DRAFT_670594 [Cladochytrium replicatum]